MNKPATTILLLTALALPVAVFWRLITRTDFSILVAALIAVAIGWALNVAWAFAVEKTTAHDASQDNSNFFAIAARFGWACPSVLVFLTWLVWYFTTRSGA